MDSLNNCDKLMNDDGSGIFFNEAFQALETWELTHLSSL